MITTMKSTTFHIALIGILLATTFQSNCSPRTNGQYAPTASTEPSVRPQSSDDKQLLEQIQQFASSDERVSTPAWQTLQSRGRQKLIEDLTRISNVSPPEDRNRALIAFTFCELGHEYASNRKIVLSALSRNPPFKNLFADWTVSLVGRLMIRGDYDLLVLLFEASDWSDGASSMELAHAYSQALVNNPETFLRLLSSQSETTKSKVMTLLKHNSFAANEDTKVKLYLKKVPRHSELRPISERTLKALTN